MSREIGAIYGLTLVILVLSIVGTVISINQGLPAEFGGRGDPDNVAGEFLTRGTAMSPPLVPLLLLAGFAFLAGWRRWWGAVALVGLVVLGVLFVIGGLGEPNSPAGSDLPDALHATLKFLGVATSLILAAVALGELARRVLRART